MNRSEKTKLSLNGEIFCPLIIFDVGRNCFSNEILSSLFHLFFFNLASSIDWNIDFQLVDQFTSPHIISHRVLIVTQTVFCKLGLDIWITPLENSLRNAGTFHSWQTAELLHFINCHLLLRHTEQAKLQVPGWSWLDALYFLQSSAFVGFSISENFKPYVVGWSWQKTQHRNGALKPTSFVAFYRLQFEFRMHSLLILFVLLQRPTLGTIVKEKRYVRCVLRKPLKSFHLTAFCPIFLGLKAEYRHFHRQTIKYLVFETSCPYFLFTVGWTSFA